jgi:hypothetical protein
MNQTGVLIGVMYFITGFFTALFLRKILSLFLIALLLFAAFAGLEAMNATPAHAALGRVLELTSSFGAAGCALIKTTIAKGTVLSIVLFCVGSAIGLVIRQRG